MRPTLPDTFRPSTALTRVWPAAKAPGSAVAPVAGVLWGVVGLTVLGLTWMCGDRVAGLFARRLPPLLRGLPRDEHFARRIFAERLRSFAHAGRSETDLIAALVSQGFGIDRSGQKGWYRQDRWPGTRCWTVVWHVDAANRVCAIETHYWIRGRVR